MGIAVNMDNHFGAEVEAYPDKKSTLKLALLKITIFHWMNEFKIFS